MKIWSVLPLVVAAQQVAVDFVLPQTSEEISGIQNESPSEVRISVSNGELEPIHISELVAVWKTQGKKRPKPYLNLSIPVDQIVVAGEDSEIIVQPTYSLPLGEYLLDFAIEGQIGEELRPFSASSDKQLVVKVVDPIIILWSPSLLASVVVLSVFLWGVWWLATNTATGWIRANVPWILPKGLKTDVRKKRD